MQDTMNKELQQKEADYLDACDRAHRAEQERDALRAENERRGAQIDYLTSECELLARASVDAQGWARTWKQAAKEKHAELDAIRRSDLGALRAENERLRISMDAMQGANDALLAAGEDHDDFEAMVARIILDRDALRQRVAALEEALRDFLHLLDGQTEPLHPVSWLATVEAGKRALLSGAAPTE